MPLQKKELRPFRTYIELVVSSELNKLLSGYKLEGKSLVDIVGGQLDYQYRVEFKKNVEKDVVCWRILKRYVE